MLNEAERVCATTAHTRVLQDVDYKIINELMGKAEEAANEISENNAQLSLILDLRQKVEAY
jgi:hypothetical protein